MTNLRRMHHVIRGRRAWLFGSLLVAVLIGTAFWRGTSADDSLVATVRRGDLTAQLTTSGTLRPIASLTYRSPVVGREVEVMALAPEGIHVDEGALLVRLDASELQRDVEQAQQELRQLQLDLQVAHGERQEAEAAVKMVAQGEGALTVDEARTRLQLAQKKVDRLRQEFEQLKPLMEKGFITREELARTTSELEQAQEDLTLARKRAEVVEQLTHPREQQRTQLQLVQKQSRLEHTVGRVQDAEARVRQLRARAEKSAWATASPAARGLSRFLR